MGNPQPLQMYWLGHPHVELNGGMVKFEMRKTLALLVYLSLEERPIAREALAAMFWPEFSQQNAFANLRRNLSSLVTALPGNWLSASHESIALANPANAWIDVKAYCQHAQAVKEGVELIKNGEEALSLYCGPFLEGFNLPDCPEFDDWQTFHRESYQKECGMVLEQLVRAQANLQRWETAVDNARRWVALDKLNEPAQQALIESLAQAGQRSTALRQYEEYARLLKDELDQKPGPEAAGLYETIRSGKTTVSNAAPPIVKEGRPEAKVEGAHAPLTAGDFILKTKLFFPKLPARLVERKRVINELDQGLERRLTFISAPAGYGKTTLLGSWIRQCPYPVAWISLDASDNDPLKFTRYAAAALQSALAEGTEPVQIEPPPSFFTVPSAAAMNFLASQLNQLCDLDIPIVLVLDDYQFITNKEVHDLTAFLIDKMPRHMSLVIASRIDPPFPIARLRASGQVLEIRTQEVRFTEDEIWDFYHNVAGLDLTPENLAILEDRTEGWAAGLQMASLVMKAFDLQSQAGRERFLAAFRGSQRFVMDYLVEEVLDRLPEEMREFLLQTSILEKMSGASCAAVVSPAAGTAVSPALASHEILENLERSNYFVVPLDDSQTWFRYHHLFRDLLLARLQKSRPGLVPDLHRRAAQWYEDSGMIEDAIRHSREIRDHERSADLLEKCIERMLTEGEVATVMQWCVELPEDVLLRHPWLCIEFLRGAYLIGTLNQYPHLFQEVERYLQAHAGAAQQHDLKMIAHFNIVKANRAFLNRDMQATIQYGDLAIQQMARDSQVRQGTMALVAYAWALVGDMEQSEEVWQQLLSSLQQNSDVYGQILSLCAFTRSFFLYTRGKLRQSFEICEDAIEILDRNGKHQLPGAGLVDLGKSFTLADWGRYEEAEPVCRRAIANVESMGMPDFVLLALQCLAVIQRHRGEIEAAEASLKQAWDFIQQVSVDPMKLAGLRYQQVLSWIAQGELEEAEHLMRNADAGSGDAIPLLRDRDSISLAHIYLARARCGERQWLDSAEKLLLQNIEAAERSGWISSLIESLALLAAVQKGQGREADALATLARALVLAEPEGYIQIFLEVGAPVHELLANMKECPVSPDYVQNILGAFQKQAQNLLPKV